MFLPFFRQQTSVQTVCIRLLLWEFPGRTETGLLRVLRPLLLQQPLLSCPAPWLAAPLPRARRSLKWGRGRGRAAGAGPARARRSLEWGPGRGGGRACCGSAARIRAAAGAPRGATAAQGGGGRGSAAGSRQRGGGAAAGACPGGHLRRPVLSAARGGLRTVPSEKASPGPRARFAELPRISGWSFARGACRGGMDLAVRERLLAAESRRGKKMSGGWEIVPLCKNKWNKNRPLNTKTAWSSSVLFLNI